MLDIFRPQHYEDSAEHCETGVARAGSSSANRLRSSSPRAERVALGLALARLTRIHGLLQRIHPSRRRDDSGPTCKAASRGRRAAACPERNRGSATDGRERARLPGVQLVAATSGAGFAERQAAVRRPRDQAKSYRGRPTYKTKRSTAAVQAACDLRPGSRNGTVPRALWGTAPRSSRGADGRAGTLSPSRPAARWEAS